MKNHFENVLESDPLRLKRYHSPYYKTVYSICVLIPFLLGFSLIFFMIFFISPRGQSLRQYQHDIFEWNGENIAQKLSLLDFKLNLKKQHSGNKTSEQNEFKHLSLQLTHKDTPEYNQEEQLGQIVSYKQSFFWLNESLNGLMGSFEYQPEMLPLSPKDRKFCIHMVWKEKNASLVNGSSLYDDVSSQGECKFKQDGVKNPVLQNGISVPIWKEDTMGMWCTNKTCEEECAFFGGLYVKETCYIYSVLERVCLKVSIQDQDSDEGKEVEYVGGCYESDQAGHYIPAIPGNVYSFASVPIEVRAKEDPYTVWAENEYNLGKDLTVFFWLSVALLGLAFLLIFVLFWMACFLVQPRAASAGRYEKNVI